MKNIITRTLTGIVFLAVLLSGLCIHQYVFLPVFAIVAGLTVWEFYGLVADGEIWPARRIIATAGGSYLFCASFLHASGCAGEWIFAPYLLFIIFIFISELYTTESTEHIRNWAHV